MCLNVMAWVNNTISRDNRTSYAQVRASNDWSTAPRGSRRYFGSILALTFGVVMVYISAHYVGAFAYSNKSIALSISSLNNNLTENSAYRRVANIAGESQYKRVYLRSNQALLISYILPDGARLKIKVLQCKSRPVLEVFKCAPVNKRTVTVKNTTRGSSKISVAKPGFYYFSHSVSERYSTALHDKAFYSVLWQRA